MTEMDYNEQQSELSRELEKADRRIRIARLKNEAEEISGGEMMVSGGDEDEDSPVAEEFWERVLEFEKAPRGTRFAQLEEAGRRAMSKKQKGWPSVGDKM